MNYQKYFRNALFAAALPLLSSCEAKDSRDLSMYDYNGMIGSEKVSFKRIAGGLFSKEMENTLRVEKSDKVIYYFDEGVDDLKVDRVRISPKNRNAGQPRYKDYFQDNAKDRMVLDEAQNQFDDYLSKIKEMNIEKAKNILK